MHKSILRTASQIKFREDVMNRLRRLRWSGLLLASAAFLPMMMNASTASAADVELRLAHWVPPQHPVQTTGFEPWAESIKQASEGRIEITIFPAQQLGAAPDHYDMARDGIADISYINAGYQPGRFPVIGLGELPFLVDNARAGARAFDEWYQGHPRPGNPVTNPSPAPQAKDL
jgi:TRAP-type C4-dicarboxylate transport system substrate-binding protein